MLYLFIICLYRFFIFLQIFVSVLVIYVHEVKLNEIVLLATSFLNVSEKCFIGN